MDKHNGAPLDELELVTKDWCQTLGVHVETVSEIVQKKPKEVHNTILYTVLCFLVLFCLKTTCDLFKVRKSAVELDTNAMN